MKKLNSIIKGALSGAVFFMAMQVGVAGEFAGYPMKSTNIRQIQQFASIDQLVLSDTLWFEVNITSSPETTPANQEAVAQPVDEEPMGDCAPENNGTICSVKLDISGITDQSAYDDLLDQIDDPQSSNPTIQDFLDLGATVQGEARENED